MDIRLQLTIPPDQHAGVYASFASIWRDNDGFILDFAVPTAPPQPMTDESTGQQFVHHAAQIVSRVRIPYGQAWEFMKGLTTQLGEYEKERNITPSEGQS